MPPEHPEYDAIRVLVVDDHPLFRRGLALVLESERDIELVGEAADGASGLALAVELAPDVVLMDVRMPGVGGVVATRRMGLVAPAAKVVMLSVSDEEEGLLEALEAGASGYLIKEGSIEVVAGAVRAVMRGRTLVSPSMAARLLGVFAELARRPGGSCAPPTLSSREQDVLRAVARGLADGDVGEALHISERTVANHVRNALEKLHHHFRAQATPRPAEESVLDLG